jgi:hypothetical protein
MSEQLPKFTAPGGKEFDVLLVKDNCPQFLIEWTDEDFEARASFKVHEITSWTQSEDLSSEFDIPSDFNEYLYGTIKWDGCSHIYFGDSGYIHLCGKHFFDLHNEMLMRLWEVCSQKITHFDKEVAS